MAIKGRIIVNGMVIEVEEIRDVVIECEDLISINYETEEILFTQHKIDYGEIGVPELIQVNE